MIKFGYLAVVAVLRTAVAGTAVAAVVAAAADTVVVVIAAAVAGIVAVAVVVVVVVVAIAVAVVVVVVVHAVDCTFFQTVVEEFVFLQSFNFKYFCKKYFFC